MAAIRYAAEMPNTGLVSTWITVPKVEEILHAVRTVFTSVMIDASDKPFEENVRLSRQIVEMVPPLGFR